MKGRFSITLFLHFAAVLWSSPVVGDEVHICSATDSGQVDCRGSVFNINISGERGRGFVVNYLDRRLKEWQAANTTHSNAKLEKYVTELNKRWRDSELQPVLDTIAKHLEQEEAGGVLDQEGEADRQRRVETIEQKLDQLLKLRVVDAEATNTRFKALEAEITQLREGAWLGKPYRLEHRLLLGGYYGLEEPLAISVHTYGASVGYRFAGRWILSPMMRLYIGQSSSDAAVTGGEPNAVSIGSIDRVDIQSFGVEACGAFGYEWRVISLALAAGLRGETLTYDPSAESAPTSHVRGLQIPLRVEVDVHLFNRLFLELAAGWIFVPNHQPLRYELDPAGQRLTLSPKEDLRGRGSLLIGGRYAVDL